ncbi:hypothetical protein ACN6K6_000627 [Streptomyces violaceoruber]|uniref:hypothetical protein n=1 Tax=Streptomyces violaceoruber TaxID=1935 RepID=UPI00403CE219
MHDPLTVAFEIRRPWPMREAWKTEQAARTGTRWQIGGAFWVLAGRGLYFPPLITVWHREPKGRDGLTVCGKHVQRRNGTWTRARGWRLHLHHWKIQVPPLQHLRRRLLTRCAWCGGRSVKGDQVNISHQWGGPRGRWWTGERGLYHRDCSSIQIAHTTCVCERPALDHGTYGQCARCQRNRGIDTSAARLARARELAAIPRGGRATVG